MGRRPPSKPEEAPLEATEAWVVLHCHHPMFEMKNEADRGDGCLDGLRPADLRGTPRFGAVFVGVDC